MMLRTIFVLTLITMIASAAAGPSLGLQTAIALDQAESGAFPLARSGQAAAIYLDQADDPGVIRAAGDMQLDIERVSGVKPGLDLGGKPSGQSVVIAGSLEKSPLVGQLIQSGKIQVDSIAGKWESFVIATLENPLPEVAQALVIIGSDKRGTIYGLYEISEQIGVSPWHWWADVPAQRKSEIFIKSGVYVQGPPAVKYRGIFINDEEPAFGQWSQQQFGGVNSKMYVRMFELILRLRGNYLWPAMWGKSIYENDPESARLADEYGVVLGTSHHEPMTRAQADWSKARNNFGNEWNYATNEEGLKRFWTEGIRRNKDYECLITVGMRGDGDEPMVRGGDINANVKLLEKIIADQREIIQREMNVDPATVPQMWALYKEVQDYYEHGMQVPDDITLLWCEDNWGNLRRVPTAEERQRSGGAGIYYHFDYVGGPRSYKWLNTNPLPKIWEQMNMAHEYGANRIWIVNVGDLKPMEIPIEFFLRMAWNPRAMTREKIAEFTLKWAEREFGPQHAAEIADIVGKYAKYNGWRKPELLEPKTFSLVNYREAERVMQAWQAIADKAETIYGQLPEAARDAYFQLVLYPVKASATVAQLHIETGFNRLYAGQGRASANDKAQRVRVLFQQDQDLEDQYHQLAGGKWNRMMSQTRIGYTSWRDPRSNIMPNLAELNVPPQPLLGVAVEGSEEAWPGSPQAAKLPVFDALNRQQRWVELFKRGSQGFEFTAAASRPWVVLSAESGSVDQDQRMWISIDWNQAPVGEHQAEVVVSRSGGESVPIAVSAVRSEKFTPETVHAAGGLTGPTAIAAGNATQNVAAGGARWEAIPDYGRGASGMAVFPVTAPSVQPPANSPRLEYAVFIAQPGEVGVDLITGPTLNVQPGRGVRIAVSFDDEQPQVVDAFAGRINSSSRGGGSSPAIRGWDNWVRDNARTLHSRHSIDAAGEHTLKIWMVDPGVVLEKIIVHTGDVRPSYFGPAESSHN